MNVARAASTVLGITTAFVAVYVAYAHVASVATVQRYVEEAEVERFASSEEVPRRFEIRKEGPLDYSVSSGVLTIQGKTHAPGGKPARMQFVGPVRSLTEGRAVMRFRVHGSAAYDVSVGIESARSGMGGLRTMRFGLANDPREPAYGVDGDTLYELLGGRRNVEDPQVIDLQRRPAFEKREEWHQIALQFSAPLRQAFAWIDGQPAGSIRMGWDTGTPVRLVFGVVAREAEQPVQVEIDDVGYEPMLPDTRSFDFVDHFDGQIVDPRRWKIETAEGWLADASTRTSPNGLSLVGKALRITQGHPATTIYAPTMGMTTFRFRAKLKINSLHHCGFFAGIASTIGGPSLRVFDMGLVDHTEKDGSGQTITKYHPFVSGHWERKAQGAFAAFPASWSGDEGTLTMEYDGKTRVGKVSVNGETVLEKRLDHQPREDVTLRFGINFNEPDASYDVLIREVELQAQVE